MRAISEPPPGAGLAILLAACAVRARRWHGHLPPSPRPLRPLSVRSRRRRPVRLARRPTDAARRPLRPSVDFTAADGSCSITSGHAQITARPPHGPAEGVPAGSNGWARPSSIASAFRLLDGDAAFGQYRQVLESYGVVLDMGDCWNGKPGDTAWIPGDELEPEPLHERHGCFFDQYGMANTRALCGDDVYIGVLGSNRDLAALYRWQAPTTIPGRVPSPRICGAGRASLSPNPPPPARRKQSAR